MELDGMDIGLGEAADEASEESFSEAVGRSGGGSYGLRKGLLSGFDFEPLQIVRPTGVDGHFGTGRSVDEINPVVSALTVSSQGALGIDREITGADALFIENAGDGLLLSGEVDFAEFEFEFSSSFPFGNLLHDRGRKLGLCRFGQWFPCGKIHKPRLLAFLSEQREDAAVLEDMIRSPDQIEKVGPSREQGWAKRNIAISEGDSAFPEIANEKSALFVKILITCQNREGQKISRGRKGMSCHSGDPAGIKGTDFGELSFPADQGDLLGLVGSDDEETLLVGFKEGFDGNR